MPDTSQGDAGHPDKRPLPSLYAEGLHKSIGSIRILAGLDLCVDGGEAVAVLGPSGSGKTTLLRLIAGLETPDSGTIRLDETELTGPTQLVAPHRRGIGYVFQSSALWPHLTVGQNVLFGVREPDKGRRYALLEEILARFEIGTLAARYPPQLSGGEARRVAMARAVAPSPQVLLFDEAFTNLDWQLKARLSALFQDQIRGRATIVFVTHDPTEAASLTDRQVLMDGGVVIPWDLQRDV